VSLATAASSQSPASAAPFPVTIRVDAAGTLGQLTPIWRFFGADEPNYATMKDGRKLIGELGALRPSRCYFRTHNLLNTGDGTPALKWGAPTCTPRMREGAGLRLDGARPIFDTYLSRGVRPYAQIGFMPKALSTNPEPYQHEWRPA
jgi:xylan 1,4-beta-xylosidase